MTGTVITLAPTGAESEKSAVPTLPVTLEELRSDAKEAEAAGASVIHLHVRDDDARPSLDPVLLRATVDAVRADTSLVVQVSSGGAVTDTEDARLAVLEVGADMASCSMGTINFGNDVFLNRWEFIVKLHTRARDLGMLLEYELFDLGHVASLHRLLDRHGLPAGGHVHCDVVLGVPGGLPATPAALLTVVRELPPGATWSATGTGRGTLPVMLTALAAGGHLRVGLEDTLRLRAGEDVTSNPELVRRAAALATLAERAPTTPSQTRDLLHTAPPSTRVG